MSVKESGYFIVSNNSYDLDDNLDDINKNSCNSDLIRITNEHIKSPCQIGTGKNCPDNLKKISVRSNMVPFNCKDLKWCKGRTDPNNGTGLMTNREIDSILKQWTNIDFNKKKILQVELIQI